jgi:hypothetical protein
MDGATVTAQCWGGPWCGRDLTVADGRKVFPVEEHAGEYILAMRVDRRGAVLHSEWTWWDLTPRKANQ